MILFDLACRGGGHVFEGWFGSTEAFEDQRARGLLSCPVCGDGEVNKAVMAPRISVAGDGPAISPNLTKAMMTRLASAQAKMLEGSDYVGHRFAAEARAMHDGDRPERQIHGQASLHEARALHEEGIAIAALPLPVRAPGADN